MFMRLMLFQPGQLLKVEQVAEKLNIAVSTVRGWVHEGSIPYHKLGSGKRALVRFDPDELNQWHEETSISKDNSKIIQRSEKIMTLKKSKRSTIDQHNEFLIGLQLEKNCVK